MDHRVEEAFQRLAPDTGEAYVSLRLVDERVERVETRQGVVLPFEAKVDRGAMIHVVRPDGGVGYAATADLSERGLAEALERALGWARHTAGRTVLPAGLDLPHPRGSWATEVAEPWGDCPLPDRLAVLQEASSALAVDARIVDWSAALRWIRWNSLFLTNGGGRVAQHVEVLAPELRATAHEGGETQTRSTRDGICQQGGLEILARLGFREQAAELGHQAIELLYAPNCPTGVRDLVLAPDQMMLQIHESIGHPLELDRILGDERNYAGTSFVTLDMFGTYRYGSELLNVTFDPSLPGEAAAYGWDEEGVKATREYLIRDGILVRPLGSALSQARAGLAGVAASRASGWNRPAIDRMANLNVEPGTSSLDELIGGVEQGVFMETNCSWSIDDSRNKFQFGCERARLIQHGRLGPVVRNPSYRGVSASFWRSLDGVGDPSTFRVYGTLYCGKGEPNQIIRVGHASPVCRFRGVDVFGGG